MRLGNPSREATVADAFTSDPSSITKAKNGGSSTTGTNARLILVSSVLFLLPALLQFATAWLQSREREALQLGCAATSTIDTGGPSSGDPQRVEIAATFVSTSENWEDDYSA